MGEARLHYELLLRNIEKALKKEIFRTMMKLFKIAFLPLLAGILLLPAASRPVRAAGSAAVEAGAGDRKRDKKKKQEADTAAKATPYEKLFKDKRVETVRGGGLTLHLTADKL